MLSISFNVSNFEWCLLPLWLRCKNLLYYLEMKYTCILVQYLDSLVLMIDIFSACCYKVLLVNARWEKERLSRVSQVKFGVYKRCISCNRNEQLESCGRDAVPHFFLHRLICYGMSQRDHMERENVTKIAWIFLSLSTCQNCMCRMSAVCTDFPNIL